MNKKILGILIILLLVIAIPSVSYLFLNKNSTEDAAKGIGSVKAKNLVVLPQEPKGEILVESATLSKKGFVVARTMDDGKLSQVIEMSKPLEPGTHKKITVPLGDADVNSAELIVMIYEDYENDGIFNDLDMPAINEDGFMTASYVKTGKPLPSSITEDSSSMMGHNMPGMKTMAKVRYTDKGFVPDKVEVPAGSMVEFVNESSDIMWVASIPHPAHTKLPTFDQFRGFKKGAIYRYAFDKKGTWEYHDHVKPSLGGEVNVL